MNNKEKAFYGICDYLESISYSYDKFRDNIIEIIEEEPIKINELEEKIGEINEESNKYMELYIYNTKNVGQLTNDREYYYLQFSFESDFIYHDFNYLLDFEGLDKFLKKYKEIINKSNLY